MYRDQYEEFWCWILLVFLLGHTLHSEPYATPTPVQQQSVRVTFFENWPLQTGLEVASPSTSIKHCCCRTSVRYEKISLKPNAYMGSGFQDRFNMSSYLHSACPSGLVFVPRDTHNHSFHSCWCIYHPAHKWRQCLYTRQHLRKK